MNIKDLIILFLLLACVPVCAKSQETKVAGNGNSYVSVNPVNMMFFQQIGITYEYQFEKFGLGVSPGYIYANNKEYSNWFIAGPVTYGSLGYYTGYYIIPHLTIRILRSKITNKDIQTFLSLKVVYRNLKIDSTQTTVWYNYGDGYAQHRKMDDNVDVYGGFVGFGFRYLINRFFIESNFGAGALRTRHDMVIYGKGAPYPSDIEPVNPPLNAVKVELNPTINFSVNIGFVF